MALSDLSPSDDQEFGAAAVLVSDTCKDDNDLIENINDQTSLLSLPAEDVTIANNKQSKSTDSNRSTPLLEEYDKFEFTNNEIIERSKEYIPKKVYREVILVTIAVFMGYASLVVIQKKLYNKYESNNGGSLTNLEIEIFEHGTSLVYFGNLCFRLLHNIIFSNITPRYRVVLSLIFISFSMLLLVLMYFICLSKWVGWVYISYLFGGIAIGSFESNLLSTITPLGPNTKIWAIIGMPVGFTCISVIGYAIMGIFKISVVYLYITTSIMGFIGIIIWLTKIPIIESYNNQNFKQFINNLKLYKQWLPKIIFYSIALMIDMFMVSFFSAINQYILDGNKLPLFGQNDNTHFINTNDFFSIYSIFSFLGDTCGRKMIYYFNLNNIHPMLYLILSIVGSFCCILRIPFITWIGIFLIFLANGLIYAASTKYIDKNIDKGFNLTAISLWLFIGDIGSVTGSNIWQLFQPIVCKHNTSHYFCVNPTSSPTQMPTTLAINSFITY
eukprot:454839_1